MTLAWSVKPPALGHHLKRITDLWFESVPERAARVIRTAWTLGARDDLKHLNLRKWAPPSTT
ncbi:hypothetical protein ACIRRX_04710 [Streptomyces bacillaris]